MKKYLLQQCRDTQSVLSYLETSLLTKWHAHQQQQLMALTLKETQHLDVTVVQAIVNGELLSYLQQQLLQKTQGDFFVYRLILQAEEPTKEPIYLSASPNLLTALEKTYLDPVIFEDTTKELLRYPEFAGIFSMDEQWRLESLLPSHMSKLMKTLLFRRTHYEITCSRDCGLWKMATTENYI